MRKKLILVLPLVCLCCPISIFAQEQSNQKDGPNAQRNMGYIYKKQAIAIAEQIIKKDWLGDVNEIKYEEEMTSRLVSQMCSKTRIILRSVRQRYPQYDWHIYSGRRTSGEQAEFYKIGRRGILGEKIITDVRVSKHEMGMAVDIYPRNKNVMEYDKAKDAYDYYGKLAKDLGLIWGGDWNDPKDYGHIELNREE